MVSGITNPDTTDGGLVVDEASDVISYQVVVENTGNGGNPKPYLSQVTLYDSLIAGYLGPPGAGDDANVDVLDDDELDGDDDTIDCLSMGKFMNKISILCHWVRTRGDMI